MRDRRQSNAYRLRVYMDAIKQAEAMTQAEWIDSQAKTEGPYVCKDTWIGYLKDCALSEATKLAGLVKAA